MKWWREARFGMFIHWGLYAEPAGFWKGKPIPGIGEWIMHDAKIPVSDYAALAPKFNPVNFDATRWAHLAKAAGMKYVVMTSKHHDGFAMFRSADPFNVYDATPFKRDPIAEMAKACKKAGLKFGVYYSQAQDWSHPGGGAFGGHWDPKQDGDFHAYVKNVAAKQIGELMRYDPDVLWWDTPLPMTPEEIQALVEPLPKGIITNNRLGNGVSGDTETPEQTIPATGFPGRDWETCMTINDTWGFKSDDHNFKSTTTLVRNLIDIASKGGNYLLNVGPDALGVIPEPEVERLNQIGNWLEKHGTSIYGSSPSPYRRLPFEGRATVKGNSLFLHVFEWPSGGLTLGGLNTKVREIRDVGTGRRLDYKRDQDGTLQIEATPTDPIATTIELKLEGKPQVVETSAALKVGPQGQTLTAADADLTGSVRIENSPANVGYWTNLGDSVSWQLKSSTDLAFEVSLTYACAPDTAGSTLALQLDGVDSDLSWTVASTDSWDNYRKVKLRGTLRIPRGLHTLRLVPKSKPGFAVMNLRSIDLTPVSDGKP